MISSTPRPRGRLPRKPSLRTAATLTVSLALIGGAAAIAPHLTAHNATQHIQRVDSATTLGTPPQWVRCANMARGQWHLNRTAQCLVQSGHLNVYREVVPAPGEPPAPPELLGTIAFTSYQQFSLQPGLTSWTESFAVSADSVSGSIPGTLSVDATSTCSAPCVQLQAHAWGGYHTISVGQTVEGNFWSQDNPAAGMSDSLKVDYKLDFQSPDPGSPGNVLTASTSWAGPTDPSQPNTQIRCDRVITGANSCIVWAFVPTLVVTQLDPTQGASAAMINWAQQNLQIPWGTAAHPLTRLSDTVRSDLNRNTICDNSFVRRGGGDSCDEFPFASTNQSGAMRGFRGTDCYEITVQYVNGAYQVTVDHAGNPAASCVRAHVPTAQNSQVGVDLQSFLNTNRVLSGDPYTAI